MTLTHLMKQAARMTARDVDPNRNFPFAPALAGTPITVATGGDATYGVFADQLDGQLCLEISPLIIYPIIDRLLGAGAHAGLGGLEDLDDLKGDLGEVLARVRSLRGHPISVAERSGCAAAL